MLVIVFRTFESISLHLLDKKFLIFLFGMCGIVVSPNLEQCELHDTSKL